MATSKGRVVTGEEARFLSHVYEDRAGCWIWTGAGVRGEGARGYGLFWSSGHLVSAHRWAYIRRYGLIADGLVVDHLCEVKACVNPVHLQAVSPYENNRRAGTVGRTYCRKGHPFDAANTYHYNGKQHCRRCRRDTMRQIRQGRAA